MNYLISVGLMVASEIVKRYLAHPCLHPFITDTGDVVGCGRCPYCLSIRRQQWSWRLEQERKNPDTLYTFGVTPTYDEDNVPSVWWCPPCQELDTERPYTIHGHSEKTISKTSLELRYVKLKSGKYKYSWVKTHENKDYRVPFYLKNCTPGLPNNLVFLGEYDIPSYTGVYRDDLGNEIIVEFPPGHSYDVVFLDCQRINVLKIEDIQRYRVAFNKWLQYNYGLEARYYISCEYGGLRDRPHYHVLFFLVVSAEVQKQRKKLKELNINDIEKHAVSLWSKGDIKLEHIDCGKFGMYMGKYLNKDTLSEYANGSMIVPEKHLMSKHYVLGSVWLKEHFKELCDHLFSCLQNKQPFNPHYDENGYQKPLPRSLKSAFFKQIDGLTDTQVRALRFRLGLNKYNRELNQVEALKSLQVFFTHKVYPTDFRLVKVITNSKVHSKYSYDSNILDVVTCNLNKAYYDKGTERCRILLENSYRYKNSLNRFTPQTMQYTELTDEEIESIRKCEPLYSSPYHVLFKYTTKVIRNRDIKKHAEEIKHYRLLKRVEKMSISKQRIYRSLYVLI